MEQPAISIEVPRNPHKDTLELLSELLLVIPNAVHHDCAEPCANVTIKIQEDIGPQFLIFTSLESQIVFKIIDYRSRASIGVKSNIKKENHQLVLSHFVSEFGLKVADFFMSIFPINLESNQVVNFTVHKDFIYFRMYRCCVTEKGPIFEKIGPHLTLRLWRMTEVQGKEKRITDFKKYVKNANIL